MTNVVRSWIFATTLPHERTLGGATRQISETACSVYSAPSLTSDPLPQTCQRIIMGSLSDLKLRIASASGSATDRRFGFADLAKTEDVGYIVRDWMSEYNMTTRGGAKVNSSGASDEFEDSFLEAILPALPHLAARHIKVAVNAGASDTEKLHDILVDKIKDAGLDLKVAWVGGDEVMDLVESAAKEGNELKSLTTGTHRS